MGKAALAVLLFAVAAAAVIGGVVLVLRSGSSTTPAAAQKPATITIRGSVDVLDTCPSTGPYRDIHRGAQVKIADASGRIIATAQLAEGAPVSDGALHLGCRYGFYAGDVPAGHDFYEVKIGNEQRGSTVLPADRAEVPLELTLGY